MGQLMSKTVLDKKSVQGFSIGVRLYYVDQDVVYLLVSVIPPVVEPMVVGLVVATLNC